MENNHVHKFEAIKIPATCKERGYTLYKCDCGYEYKEDFTPLGQHNYVKSEEKQPDKSEDSEGDASSAVTEDTHQSSADNDDTQTQGDTKEEATPKPPSTPVEEPTVETTEPSGEADGLGSLLISGGYTVSDEL